MDKLTPCLWFDGVAEEAARFYVSLFPDSRIDGVHRAPADSPSGPKDTVLNVDFTLAGRSYIALNGGPEFTFNEAISLSIDCQTQAEIDELWEKLSTGGSKGQCGWLKDRYGLSWQVVPAALPKLLADTDHAKTARVMEVMMGMTKLDLQALQDAATGN